MKSNFEKDIDIDMINKLLALDETTPKQEALIDQEIAQLELEITQQDKMIEIKNK